MKVRRIRLAATATRQIEDARAWWFKNRAYHAIFDNTLTSLWKRLSLFPSSGTPYARYGTFTIRRVYLQKLDAHVYYRYDDHKVIVLAYSGARRLRNSFEVDGSND